MSDVQPWKKGAHCAADWNELNTLAHIVGMQFYRAQYESKGTARYGALSGRTSLERIAREHLGTAAVAILQGVVYR